METPGDHQVHHHPLAVREPEGDALADPLTGLEAAIYALEALIGAIYLDCGFEKATITVRQLIKETLESAMAKGAGLDGKTALQELLASLGKGSPEYVVTETGPDHDKSFTAIAMVSGEAVAEGLGKSKREAEQSAARTAFEILSQQKPE